MKRIFKYPLKVQDVQFVQMPENANILSCVTQYGTPTVYAMVEEEETATELVAFYMYGTGHEMDDIRAKVFLGTVCLQGDTLVLHVFVRTREEDKVWAPNSIAF